MAIDAERDATRRDALRLYATAWQDRLARERVGAIEESIDLELRFRHGLVRRISVRRQRAEGEPPEGAGARLLDALLATPNGGFVREVLVDGCFFAPVTETLAAHALQTLAALMTCGRPSQARVSLACLGALPRLERLDLSAAVPSFEGTTLPACRDLVLRAESGALETLGLGVLPRLVELTVEGGESFEPPVLGAAASGRAAIAIAGIPSLRKLRLGHGLLELGRTCARVAPQLESIWAADTGRKNLASRSK